ncbi:hypothetical protein WME75_42575 [Sorangium sp. So ce1014]|uniref:hypothetical protein n=1 Tax=Sorangium sp. So ce1014 TaxID=3133326 RepID=UPI003F60310A
MDQANGAAAATWRSEGTFEGGEPVSSRITVKPADQASAGLVAVLLGAIDEAARTAAIRIDGEEVEATVDPSVDPAVLRTALRRRERVIAQREGGAWVVLGALRTAATPGVDEGDDFTIKARRVTVEAAHEFSVISGAASFVLRAYGHVETLAQDITARASGVNKIIGRMIRLN